MSKKSRAWLKASQQMAETQGYNTTLGHLDLEEWLAAQQDQHSDTWDVIWKAARRAEWEKCQDDQEALQSKITKLMLANEWMAANQLQLAETAKKRLEEIHRLEREMKYATSQLVARNKELADALGAVKTAKSFTSSAQARSIELLRSNQTLRQENEDLKRRLVEATALTTEGTRTLQERFDKLQEERQRGERLYEQISRENDYHENAANLAEEEVKNLRDKLAQERTAGQAELDALKADVNYFRDKLAQVTTPVPVDPTQQRLVDSLRSALNASMAKRDELLTRTLEAEQKLAAVPGIAFRKPAGDGWVLSWTRMTGQTITGRVTEHGDGSKTTFDYNPATGMAASTWSGTPYPKPCLSRNGAHRCNVRTATYSHPGLKHTCHCGATWH